MITLTQAFSAGTLFDFDFSRTAGARWQWGANTANGGSAAGIQETTSTSFGLNSSGDNLFIYQGEAPTSGTASNWIAAFSSTSFLTTGVAGTDQTYLPAAFTEGVNAFSLGLAGQAANQNGGLNDLGTVTGTATGIRTTVYTLSNWTISVGNVAMPSPTVFTISSATIGTSGTLAALTTVYGTASATTSITVTGSGLTGDITATAPAGFQVSSDGTSFGGTATFTQSSGAVSGTLYVRLSAATAVGTYSGSVTLGSSGASSVNAATTSSTVTPARLTVVANDFTRLYGAANPTFTVTISGYVNGENASVLSGAPSLTTAATTTSGIGSYTIAAAAGTLAANAGNYTFAFVDGGLTVLPAGTPVKVSGVYAKGSAWNATYLGLSAFTTVGSDALGWAMVDGANQTAASSSLTWTNVDTISLRFNQPISLPAAAALALVLGDNQGDQTITPSSTPTLLAGGTIAQWTVPALGNGKYVISVASSGISDAGGTTVLDGDWTSGTSTFAQGSGDGTAGGMFNFFFNVLVADVNG
ncbi:MAG: hypothetical protein EBX35_14095, partial [Planctomycetia bacterium]|nr:hypothetical protein [Planctomycetia bacterium]